MTLNPAYGSASIAAASLAPAYGGSGAGAPSTSAGTSEQLLAGSDETQRTWSAADLSAALGVAQTLAELVDAKANALAGALGSLTALGALRFGGEFDVGGGVSFASFPVTIQKGYYVKIVNANGNGTTIGSSSQLVVRTGDILMSTTESPSSSDGADWAQFDA